jgi:hypothetical protein
MRSVSVDRRYLERLMECLVIQYSFDEVAKSLFVVFDHWEKASGSDLTFLRLKFDGVADFNRKKGERLVLQSFTTRYNLKLAPSPTVVQGVIAKLDQTPKRADLHLGSAFGDIAFCFDSVSGVLRDTRANKMGNDWEYFDLETGERVDFYSPFGD